ncbi:hypothetical protein J4734_24210, partial [Klebsiella pneumoniae]|nr:hypothetical protein [Klebsiella pneumoniae]
RPSWSVTVRSAGLAGEKAGAEQRQPSSKGCFNMVWPEWRENCCVLNYITKPGAMGDRIYPHQ